MVESGRVLDKVKSVPIMKNCADEFRKIVESGRVPGKARIRTSTEKLYGRVSEKGRISASTEKW